MPNTYTQLYIHIVFTVQGRENLIQNKWKLDLHKYISGIIKQRQHKPLIINGMPDHIHVFVGLNPSQGVSDLVRDIKAFSAKHINDQKLLRGKFSWQEGYGAFSYSKSQIEKVYHYIQHQEEHHKKQTFKEEYIGLLKKFNVDYDERYLFDFM